MNDKYSTKDQETIQLLQALKETPARDPEQAAKGKEAFLEQAQQISHQPVSIPPFQRLINVFRLPKLQLQFSTLTIGIILGILLLTFSSSTYAARLSKPDQPLYPLKLWLENSRLSLTNQPDKQIDLHLVFAEERLKELSEESKTYSTAARDRAMHNLYGHVEALRNLVGKDDQLGPRQERLETILDRYNQFYQEDEDDRDSQPEEDQSENSSGDDQGSIAPEEETSEEAETPEEQEEQEDTEEKRDQSKDKHRTESGEGHHDRETDEPDEEEPVETEETEEPEETKEPDKTEEPEESDDPTKTPEPDDD